MSKGSLRKQFLRARLNLSHSAQHSASVQIAKRISGLPVFKQSRYIGFYLTNKGEINPALLLSKTLQQRKNCYLPCLTTANTLIFRRYQIGLKMHRNRFNILEPPPRAQRLLATQLDLVLVPLVAFDLAGNRLGMGGGFYDRTFEFKKRFRHGKPVLIGLAHSIQQAKALPVNDFDVPLDYIITESQIRQF